MRDNNFKIWCKNKKEWEKNICFMNEKGQLLHETRNGLKHLSSDTHEAVFDTNLKSKDKNRIYEGDFISAENIYPLLVVVEKGHTLIKWKDNGINCSEYLTQEMINDDDLKIIGNKYEHPDLLEEE